MLAFRIASPGEVSDLTGHSAALHGGRWNLPDQPALYLGLSPAGCALEATVIAGHLPHLPLKLLQLRLPADPALYLQPRLTELPEGWNALPADRPSMAFGSDWLRRGEQLGLILPSLAIDQTRCLMINPQHPASLQIEVLHITDFAFGRPASHVPP